MPRARKTMTVDVTQEILDEVVRPVVGPLYLHCPLAKALSAATGRLIGVGLNGWWTHDEGTLFEHRMTKAMIEFRKRFDDGKDVKPHKFLIPIRRTPANQ